MYITENGLGIDLFVHLNVICDKWTTYNGRQLYSRFVHSWMCILEAEMLIWLVLYTNLMVVLDW